MLADIARTSLLSDYTNLTPQYRKSLTLLPVSLIFTFVFGSKIRKDVLMIRKKIFSLYICIHFFFLFLSLLLSISLSLWYFLCLCHSSFLFISIIFSFYLPLYLSAFAFPLFLSVSSCFNFFLYFTVFSLPFFIYRSSFFLSVFYISVFSPILCRTFFSYPISLFPASNHFGAWVAVGGGGGGKSGIFEACEKVWSTPRNTLWVDNCTPFGLRFDT